MRVFLNFSVPFPFGFAFGEGRNTKNHAFINITHSFIIYYCVLLSVLLDTFFNTLRNQPYLCSEWRAEWGWENCISEKGMRNNREILCRKSFAAKRESTRWKIDFELPDIRQPTLLFARKERESGKLTILISKWIWKSRKKICWT